MLDVTKDAKEITKALRDIINRKTNIFTLVLLRDIFKDSNLKDITESGLYSLHTHIMVKEKLN